MSDIALAIVEYDAESGMEVLSKGKIAITLCNGDEALVENVKFFDTVRGYIETTDGKLYIPSQGDLASANQS